MDDRTRTRRRLAVGVGALVVSAVPASRSSLPKLEARIFRSINRLPDSLYIPIWPVMQAGALAAVPAAAGLAATTGHRPLARRVLVTGTSTWLAAKVIKRCIKRGRPQGLVSGVRVRGQAASGHGFLSGHAGVSTALAAAAMPMLPHLRFALAGVAATVGVARIYVGAHLPLDVVGGAALGMAIDATVTWMMDTD